MIASETVFDKDDFNDKYNISSRGFLPEVCVELPERYDVFNNIMSNLSTNNGDKFRIMVDQFAESYNGDLSLLNIDDLTLDEVKTLYSKMSMLNHKYIWCKGPEDVKTIIPYITGILWYQASEKLGIGMVLTHASLDLYNWRLLKPLDIEAINADNIFDYLTNIHCFSDDSEYRDSIHKKSYKRKMSEQGFYLPMTLVEMAGGSILYDLYSASTYMDKGDNKKLNDILINLSKKIELVVKFTKMTNSICSPELFFNELRIYLGGFNNTEYFPKGLKIDRIDDKKFIFKGGSAAQSSLIQVFDIFLSVEHNKNMNDFYLDTRKYMPIKHRNFIEDMEKMKKIKDYISDQKNSKSKKNLEENYNMCRQNLLKFRFAHKGLIDAYVIHFIKKSSHGINGSAGTDPPVQSTHGTKGSAGTDPNSVIKDTIAATRKFKFKDESTKLKNTSIEWLYVTSVLGFIFFLLIHYLIHNYTCLY